MRIAYLLNWELDSQDGVSKKVLAQTHAWQSLQHEVKVFCILKNPVSSFGEIAIAQVVKSNSSNILQEFKSVYKAYQDMLLHLEQYNPDIVYFRFDIYQPALDAVLKKFRTVVEINTNDIEELKLISRDNLRGKFRYYYHLLLRSHYLSQMSGFCCVTNEIADLPGIRKFNKPVFVIPNSINCQDYSCPSSLTSFVSAIPRLVFIGSPNQAWHGLDKLIAFAKNTCGLLEFEVIGTKGEQYNDIPSNLRFHGYLKKEAYEQVVCSSDIGICTLALHRNNMEEASPLKTREYLAYGLPIILGYKDTAFVGRQLPPWALELPNTELNLLDNLEEILDFCNRYKGVKLAGTDTNQYIDALIFEKLRLNQIAEMVFKR